MQAVVILHIHKCYNLHNSRVEALALPDKRLSAPQNRTHGELLWAAAAAKQTDDVPALFDLSAHPRREYEAGTR